MKDLTITLLFSLLDDGAFVGLVFAPTGGSSCCFALPLFCGLGNGIECVVLRVMLSLMLLVYAGRLFRAVVLGSKAVAVLTINLLLSLVDGGITMVVLVSAK